MNAALRRTSEEPTPPYVQSASLLRIANTYACFPVPHILRPLLTVLPSQPRNRFLATGNRNSYRQNDEREDKNMRNPTHLGSRTPKLPPPGMLNQAIRAPCNPLKLISSSTPHFRGAPLSTYPHARSSPSPRTTRSPDRSRPLCKPQRCVASSVPRFSGRSISLRVRGTGYNPFYDMECKGDGRITWMDIHAGGPARRTRHGHAPY
jgi:hypothetical protein